MVELLCFCAENAPSAPLDLHEGYVTGARVSLGWSEPEENSNNVVRYIVYFREANSTSDPHQTEVVSAYIVIDLNEIHVS